MLRAIDLYSGIGGWTLGLVMAGIEVLESYERWSEANLTHFRNLNIKNKDIDIRELSLDTLPQPESIDFVVGSPPCTQFSYANRGGSGDISDGLKDIYIFLKIVKYLKPKKWAMENVPRVKGILEKELGEGGQLEEFKSMVKYIETFNIADFGIPQNRKRMIAGDYPLKLLMEYRKNIESMTMGVVINSLTGDPICDPIYGIEVPREMLSDNETEVPLNREEERMNREAKTYHPIYNKMCFPDQMDRPARTITATCTRVSRESIIVPCGKVKTKYRRLTIRERASLQSFPITYQFYGNSYSSRIKMIGNALPPLFAFYIAHSMMGSNPVDIPSPSNIPYRHPIPKITPKTVKGDRPGTSYPHNRRFRMVIPELRFGSGHRFELVNFFEDSDVRWKVSFYYGTSKNILDIPLDRGLYLSSNKYIFKHFSNFSPKGLDRLEDFLNGIDPEKMQDVWSHKGRGTHPFTVLKNLSAAARGVIKQLRRLEWREMNLISDFVLSKLIPKDQWVIRKNGDQGMRKLRLNSMEIMSGFLIGSIFNMSMKRKGKK